MIVAVTGGTGFIGSHLVEALIARGDTVRLLSRKEVHNTSPGLTNYVVDYNRVESLHTSLTGCDAVYHLAAALRATDQASLVEINRKTAGNLLNAIAQVIPTAKIILCSSQAAAGPAIKGRPRTERDRSEPISWYGKSKLAAEQEFEKQSGIDWTILRPSAVFGPRERDIFVFFKALSRGWSTQIGTIRRRFSWIVVHDFIDALLVAGASTNLKHRTNFVVSGDTDWNEFRTIAAEALGRTYHLLTLPKWSVTLTAACGDGWSKLSGKPVLLNRDKISELSSPDWRCDDTTFRQLTGYQPRYDLSRAIHETIAWYRREKWIA